MIVTDKDARDKYCPIIGGKCMGEECMAWQEEFKPRELGPGSQYLPLEVSGKGYCAEIYKDQPARVISQ